MSNVDKTFLKLVNHFVKMSTLALDETNYCLVIRHGVLPNIKCAYTILDINGINTDLLKKMILLDSDLDIYPRITYSEVLDNRYLILGFSTMDVPYLEKYSVSETMNLLIEFRNKIIILNQK